MELSVSTADIGEGSGERWRVQYAGDELAVGYNAVYLLDALQDHGYAPTCRSSSTPPTSPGVLTPAEQGKDEDLLCLVMPLRLPDA